MFKKRVYLLPLLDAEYIQVHMQQSKEFLKKSPIDAANDLLLRMRQVFRRFLLYATDKLNIDWKDKHF